MLSNSNSIRPYYSQTSNNIQPSNSTVKSGNLNGAVPSNIPLTFFQPVTQKQTEVKNNLIIKEFTFSDKKGIEKEIDKFEIENNKVLKKEDLKKLDIDSILIKIKEELYFYDNYFMSPRFIVLYERENLSQEKPIGMALFCEDRINNDIYLSGIVTRADVRGEGSKLIKYIFNNSKPDTVEVDIKCGAFQAYEKMGFKPKESMPNSNRMTLNPNTSELWEKKNNQWTFIGSKIFN